MKRIFLDPGHGGSNDNVVQGFSEAKWNLDFCRKLKTALEATGHFIVELSRDSDIDISLQQRATKAQQFGADMLISVHSNAGGGSGSVCFYSLNQPYNANMAANLSWACSKGYEVPDLGGRPSPPSKEYPGKDYYGILRYSVDKGIKAVFLLERAFHDNDYDRAQLQKPECIDKAVQLIVDEIMTFYNLDSGGIGDLPDILPVPEEDEKSWKAVAIIQDLAIMATTIEGEGEDYNLNRSICNVYVEDYVIEEEGELKHYTIPKISFPISMTYAEACQQIIDKMGNVAFGCDRYGDIYLKNLVVPSQNDEPKFEITDYIDLSSFTHEENVVDLRNRIIVQSKSYGMAMFEHKLLTNAVMKGVNRMMLINVDWADSLEKMREAAKNAFQQMLSHHKKMSIAIKGNPLIEKYDIVKVKDKHTGIDFLYQVREFRHSFTPEGFITFLELNFVADCDDSAVEFITDEFPQYVKTFGYNLALSKQPKSIKLTLEDTIRRVKIKIKDGKNVLAEIDVVGDTYRRVTNG